MYNIIELSNSIVLTNDECSAVSDQLTTTANYFYYPLITYILQPGFQPICGDET